MPSIETTDELIPPSLEADNSRYSKIQYFSEIITSAYKTPYGADTWSTQYLINKILEDKGFTRFDRNGKSTYLRDLAFNNFPEWWLNKIYEDAKKAPGKHSKIIDKVLKHSDWRYYEYALAIALLLELEEWARYREDHVLISIHGIERVNRDAWAATT